MDAQKASTVKRALIVGVGIAAGATFFAAVQTKQSEPDKQAGGAGQFFRQVTNSSVSLAPQLKGTGSGGLEAVGPKGKKLGTCALKHTDVSVHISGYMASVDVKQSFHNPFDQKIEAVYTFPLSDSAAVDDMTMRVGDRLIHGTIKRKAEAHRIYERAKEEGEVASVLDQERPNVFTESVANIEPGKEIDVTVHYVDLLPFESGAYSFVFPTVVGPRFNPGAATVPTAAAQSGQPQLSQQPLIMANSGPLEQQTSSAPHTASAQPELIASSVDAGQPASTTSHIDSITYAPEGTRSGHDISISVDLDAGLPVDTVCSTLHAIDVNPISPTHAHIALHNQATIPNKDFVLSWNVGADTVKSGYLTYKDGKSGFLTMMLVPPKRVTTANAAPKEMIFVIDRSGSQDGPPLDKAKETMLYILQHMNPNDTFQIVSFADNAEQLFDKPAKVSSFTRKRAQEYIQSLTADGGTWLGKAVEKVCSTPEDEHRLKVVTFMTDGEIGNDEEILGMIRKYRGNARWFSFGTGDSVNHFLIDGIAKEGGGEADYINLNRPGAEVAEHFYNMISSPVLTDVHVDFDGVKVEDVLPRTVSDVWAERPVYIKARYTQAGHGIAHLHGFAGGKPYNQDIPIILPDVERNHSEIAQIWARSAVDELMALDWFGANDETFNKKLTEQVIRLALQFHIMTQFTSFVAVDEKSHTSAGQPVLTEVPVDVPEGTSLSGLFSEGDKVVAENLRQALIHDTNETLNTWQGKVLTGTQPDLREVIFGSWQSLADWLDPARQQEEAQSAQDSDDAVFGDEGANGPPPGQSFSGGSFKGKSTLNPSSGSAAGGAGQAMQSGDSVQYQIVQDSPLVEDFKSTPSTPMPNQAAARKSVQYSAMMQTPVPTPIPQPAPAMVPPPPPLAGAAAPHESATLAGKSMQVTSSPPVYHRLGAAPAPALIASTSAAGQPLKSDTNGAAELQGSLPYPSIFERDGKTAQIARSLHIGLIAKILDFGTVAFGFFFIVKGLVGLVFHHKGWRSIIFGITWIVVGFSCCLALIPWAVLIVCVQMWRIARSKSAPPTPPQVSTEHASAKV